MNARSVRIGNISGFYGDRLEAAQELLSGDGVDFLTGDYLAELTMYLLHKDRSKNPEGGYARTFPDQVEPILATVAERGIKIVVNAGGLAPRVLAARLRDSISRAGLELRVAHVEGDDVLDRLDDLQAGGERLEHLDTGVSLAERGVVPVTANAYLGAWPIVAALEAGADIVITGRVTDAALTVAPAAWWHGWSPMDYDRLAGAVAAGHVIECGPQATGGNYPVLEELAPGRRGYPIVQVDADGSAIFTKNPGTGGAVTVGTVTAQLLYEIQGPDYRGPDVTAWFDTLRLDQIGPDRVRMSGTRGTPPGDRVKVAVNYEGGYRNAMTLVLTGLGIEGKARLALDLLFGELGGEKSFDEVDVRLIRSDRPNAATEAEAFAYLTVTVKDRDKGKVGRRFSNTVTELFLAGYAGFFTTTPPSEARAYGVYWPTLIPAQQVLPRAVLPGGETVTVPLPGSISRDGEQEPARPDPRPAPRPANVADERDTVRLPLGRVAAARSGDKGGNANIGVWVRTPSAYPWLVKTLTPERVAELVPEARGLAVSVWPLANILGVNIVIAGLLGDGVASSTRMDPQAKALGEYLRSRIVEIPRALVKQERGVDHGRDGHHQGQ